MVAFDLGLQLVLVPDLEVAVGVGGYRGCVVGKAEGVREICFWGVKADWGLGKNVSALDFPESNMPAADCHDFVVGNPANVVEAEFAKAHL